MRPNPKLRIWSHLLQKVLIENFIFLCNGLFLRIGYLDNNEQEMITWE